ncbi:50S ribosomal protein L18 [Candidatus Parcubacteria bacterium]|uniref:Large ribosomal subunit protein uL18 n=1 Tax=Candidatus Kaiserbacteria bacterium CG10_big_fil_rev_8_21_14_0_10_47_16 TaxID=1974608 RepID=A0A2H0UG59_9BACT|nr:50S ribosomal protein L18 [Candidatus Parcubacteria bacterium]PIR84666.1 MAG: 50S ribosomal protein L18 [Candidatus Kaiserbacteria bacterium CG10_big_fil_rev_8_21_14_0_10_47_16]
MNNSKITLRTRRHARIRSRIIGTAERPRLAVFRSNRAIYAQLIDDAAGTTIAAADSRTMKETTSRGRAGEVGKAIAKAATAKGITAVVFDRGGFQYQGVIAAVADGAREGGLTF